MRAMLIEEFGAVDRFVEREIPRPTMKPGHVLIKVQATSVNAVDLLIRQVGPPFLAPALPAVLHSDVAGIVVDVDPEVKEFKIGDEVYGCAGGLSGLGGALGEYMLADTNLIAHKPKCVNMAEAAALPLVTLTAWEALHERVHLRPGQKLLVHGGAGGVGHIAIQLAAAIGADVYATVSSEEKANIARTLGANTTINYHDTPVSDYVERYTGGNGFDVIFDTLGNENLMTSFEAAKLNGDVVTTVALGQYDMTTAHLKGLSVHIVFMLIPLLHNTQRNHHGAILREAAHLVDAGKLRPLIDPNAFTMSNVAAAHKLMESGEHVGKIVLTYDECSA